MRHIHIKAPLLDKAHGPACFLLFMLYVLETFFSTLPQVRRRLVAGCRWSVAGRRRSPPVGRRSVAGRSPPVGHRSVVNFSVIVWNQKCQHFRKKWISGGFSDQSAKLKSFIY